MKLLKDTEPLSSGTKSKKSIKESRAVLQEWGSEVTALKIDKFASNPQYLRSKKTSSHVQNPYRKYFDYDQLPKHHKFCVSEQNKEKSSHQSTMVLSGKSKILKRIKSQIISTSNQLGKQKFDRVLNYRRKEADDWTIPHQFIKRKGNSRSGLVKKKIDITKISKNFRQIEQIAEEVQKQLNIAKVEHGPQDQEALKEGIENNKKEIFHNNNEELSEDTNSFCLNQSEVLKKEQHQQLDDHSSDEIEQAIDLLSKGMVDNQGSSGKKECFLGQYSEQKKGCLGAFESDVGV